MEPRLLRAASITEKPGELAEVGAGALQIIPWGCWRGSAILRSARRIGVGNLRVEHTQRAGVDYRRGP